MAPLSGKQQREYLKFQNKEAREASKMGLDEMRKQQLHEIKLQEAAAKANQGLGHKEQVNNARLKDMGIPPVRMNKQKLGIPTQNPLAGTGMFKQGQRSLAQAPMFQAQGTDTVPAMLTPGEAVIPKAAAQNPKNKKAIKRMVQEGRRANMRDGAVDVRNSDAPLYSADGTSGVPSLAYHHPDVPGSSFMHGTMSVPDFSRGSSAQANYSNGTYGVVPQQVQSAAGYEDGTENVSYLDRLLNFVAGQQIPSTQPVVAPLASNAVTPTEVSKEDFFKMRSFAEASNDPRAKQKQAGQTASSLTGTTAGTLPLYQKINPKLQGVAHNSEAYFKPEFQRELSDTQYDDYAKQLKKKGLPLTVENLYAAGFGPRAVSAIAAKDDEPLDKHFTKNELKQNTYFGKTAGDFKNFVAQKANKAGKSLAQTVTDIIPSAQAGTLPNPEASALTNENASLLSRYPVPPVPTEPTGREVLIAKQDLATSTNPRVIQAAKDVLARANQAIPTLADTRAPIFNVAPPDLVNNSAQQEVKNLLSNYPVTSATVPVTNEVPKPIDIVKNEQAIANDQAYNMSLGEGKQVEVPAVDGTGFSKQNADKFNTLGVESRKELDNISQAVRQATQMQGTLEEKKGFLANILSGIFGPKGLFNDKDLIRFGILAAGGMLTGGSVGGSLRVAGLNTLQSADKRQAEQFATEQQDKRFTQQEDLLDKRFAKEREFRKEDLIRAENKQLETEMIKEGRDSVAVRNWIKGGQKGEVPAIKTSYIRNGNSELMTVTSPIKLGEQVFKPGDPVYVYQMTQQVGPRKGETIQMARIGNQDIPFENLMSKGFYLSKWNEGTHGEIAKLKRAQDFSEKLSKNIFEPIVESYFGASNVKGKANPERKGIVTAGSAASQVESYFRGKVNLDDRAVQNEIEKITTIASEQLVKDIESGTYKVSKDITPYLAAGEFRERGKLSDKLVTLDKKSGRIMSAEDILSLRDSANTFISKNKANTSPDAEIARLAEVWTANTNGIQNRYKNSDRNTAFALFALDTFKK